jgi:hypothetical protein
MTPERTRLLAEKARIEAELAKLDAEPDWEAWRPAVGAYYAAANWRSKPKAKPDILDKRVMAGLIAAAPLMPRDAGMTDAAIEELRDVFSIAYHKTAPDNAVLWHNGVEDGIRAIRETLKRAPLVRWPEEDEISTWSWEITVPLMEKSTPNSTHYHQACLEMASRLKAHLTGEGK